MIYKPDDYEPMTDEELREASKAFVYEKFILPILSIPVLIILISYPMAIYRWFTMDHFSFWNGFKELLWCLLPIVNITYVWDWWASFFIFLDNLLKYF